MRARMVFADADTALLWKLALQTEGGAVTQKSNAETINTYEHLHSMRNHIFNKSNRG